MRPPPAVPVLAVLLLAASAWADDGRVHVSVQVRDRIGGVSGTLQTPKGGGPGTTSLDRPTLAEIGVQVAHEPGIRVQIDWRKHELLADAGFAFLHGGTTLGNDLISQAQTFPQNTDVDSKTWLAVGRASYRYRLAVPLGREWLEIHPGVGVGLFRFHYQLDGSNGAGTNREYGHPAPEVDLGLLWRPGGEGPVWFTADVWKTLTFALPESNQTDIFEAVVAVHYDLSCHASAHAEIGYRHFGFRDQQEVPNDIDIRFGPWFGLGLSLNF
jgi:hypothetical protein